MTLSKPEISQMCEAAFDRLFIKNQSCVMRAMKIYTIRKVKSDRYIWLFTDYLKLIPQEFKEQDLLEILAESPFKEEQSTEISYTQEVDDTEKLESSINQPPNQPTSQPPNQPKNEPLNQSTSQPLNQPANQPANQPLNQPTNQPTNQPLNQPENQFTTFDEKLEEVILLSTKNHSAYIKELTQILRDYPPKEIIKEPTCIRLIYPHHVASVNLELHEKEEIAEFLNVISITQTKPKTPPIITAADVVEGCFTLNDFLNEVIFNVSITPDFKYVAIGEIIQLDLGEVIYEIDRTCYTEQDLASLYALINSPTDNLLVKKPLDNLYTLVDSEKKLEKAIALLSSAKSIAIDTETTGLDPYTNKLRLIQLAIPEQTFIIDCFKVAIKPLAKLFDNPDLVVIGHNLSFDLKFLQRAGVKTKCKLFDTMIAYKLLNSGLGKEASLKNVLQDILGIEIDNHRQTSNWSSEELSQTQLDYAATDVVKLPELYEKLKKQLIDNKLVSIAKLEFDCILAVVEMELSGFLLDAAKWEQHKIVAKEKLHEISDRLIGLFGNINFNSAQQIKTALSSAGIKVQKTDYETLAPLAAQYPEITTLLEYKKISSLINKFLKGYLEKLNPVSGRLHSSFNQMGAETGRFSSNNPNLQQIPRDKDIRSCFIAAPGNKLVIADYSQIELRIAAEISQDIQMIKAFNNGDDLHKLTASLVLGKPLEEVTKSDRQIAKSLNFGLLYGMGAEGLQKYAETSYGVNLSLEDAKSYRDKFFQAYRGLAKWHEATKKKLYAHKVTRSETLGGRKRDNIKGITDMLNTPVQGTGADILKLALGELAKVLPDGVKLIACVHDEIILECPQGVVDEAAAILKEVMIKAGEKYLKTVPVEVDVSVGDSWGDKG